MQTIKAFINQYFRADDKILLTLLFSILPISFGYYLANADGSQFTGIQIISMHYLILIPIMTLLYIVSLFARDISPRIGFITWTYTMYYFLVMISGILIYYIQLTPFSTVDFSLVKIDSFLGFNQTAWLNWTYAHPWIRDVVNQCYGLMTEQLVLVPLILAILMQKRSVRVLFMSIIISFIIGTAIYYLLPTTAPASMFHDPHFALQQHDTYVKFYQIHHHLPTTTSEGGLIAFPSFHVIWAVIIAYSFRHKKYLFYPMALFNAVIILSTLMLGWHYLTDVISGIILAGLSILISEVIHQKFIATERVTEKKEVEDYNPATLKLRLNPITRK